VSTFDEVIENIDRQVDAARELCSESEAVGVQIAGCPGKYSGD
jgi:hypothetical protein